MVEFPCMCPGFGGGCTDLDTRLHLLFAAAPKKEATYVLLAN